MSKPYQLAAVGGTFDRFHLGHQHLLTVAASSCHNLIVGITQNHLNQGKVLAPLIEAYSVRAEAISNYLKHQFQELHFDLVPLTDPFGPTLTNPNIEALIVSPQTQSGVDKLQSLRLTRQMPPLAITISSMIDDDSGQYLSSTRIRQGLVNRQGFVYASLFQKNIHLSDTQKQLIRQTKGDIVDFHQITQDSLSSYSSIALVGDQVTQNFIDQGLPFDYAIIDNHVQRHLRPLQSAGFPISARFTNPPGTIKQEVSDYIFNLKKSHPQIIEIDGEEDLLGFPFALSLPLQSVLFYGEPNLGLAQVDITESTKDRLAQIFR